MLRAGFPWGPGRTKPFCWMVAFPAMGRARPAGDEHGRYTPSSEAEPSEGSAGWGQARGAWGAEKRGSPVTPQQMSGAISQSGRGSSGRRPELATAARHTRCPLDPKEKGF